MRTARVRSSATAALALAPAQDRGDWNIQVTPYVWGSGVSGDLTPVQGGPTVEFDESLSEVLENLDSAFFLSAYARSGRFVLLGDVSASSSSREGFVPPGIPAEGEVQQRSVTLAAGWRTVETPRVTVDLLAGLRTWNIEVEAAVPAAGFSATREVNFTDPILAARANIPLAPRFSAILYGDFGGFGVGSDQTAQVVATVNYAVSEKFYISGGYRWFHVDYDSDGTAFEATMSGPLLGVTWRF